MAISRSADNRQRYPVVLLSRNPSNYEPLVQEIEAAGGKATGISTDVTSPDSVREAFGKIKAMGAGSSAPTCAAAIMNGAGSFARKPFLEQTQEDFENGCVKAS